MVLATSSWSVGAIAVERAALGCRSSHGVLDFRSARGSHRGIRRLQRYRSRAWDVCLYGGPGLNCVARRTCSQNARSTDPFRRRDCSDGDADCSAARDRAVLRLDAAHHWRRGLARRPDQLRLFVVPFQDGTPATDEPELTPARTMASMRVASSRASAMVGLSIFGAGTGGWMMSLGCPGRVIIRPFFIT